ncbi:hypothetical protein [Curtanaerobium respiraculi]|uniref:hypothetical protein n=1 Tax=Curtanaerobium respiraculi TaxID=2949669 RepID=UPI0024B386FD|nr:hypothetical protein [Curtanaerobium respiraculi]
MNRISRIARLAVAACLACAALFAVVGCVPGTTSQQQQPTVASDASDNRAYMATLNRQTASLQESLDAFQQAVADKDAVTMQAKLNEVESTIDSVKNTEVTDRLSSVKDAYVDALCTLDDAMRSYVALYNDAKNSTLDADTYASRLAEVQSAYDSGMEKMKAADDAVKEIANA